VWPSNPAATSWRTMVGKKVVMAVTGIVLVGFVIAHMLGNLKIFLGAEAIGSLGARGPIHPGELDGGGDVQRDAGEEDDTNDPQRHAVGKQRLAHRAEERRMGVGIRCIT